METGAWRIFGGQRSSSEAENFHSMCEALGLILPIQKGKRIKKSLNCCIYNIYTSSQPSDLFISCLGLLVLLSELGFVLQTWFFFSDCVSLAFTHTFVQFTPPLVLLVTKLSWQVSVASLQQGQQPCWRASWDSRTVRVCPFCLSPSAPPPFPTACALSFLPGRVFL